MAETNWIVLIVAFFVSVLSPMVLALLTQRESRMMRREDRAEKAAAAKLAAADAAAVGAKLDVLHTLGNSLYTAAKQSEYDALARDLASMTALSALKPTDELIAEMAGSRQKIAVLRKELDERQAQAKLIEKHEAERLAGIAHASSAPVPVKVEVVPGPSPIPVKIKE